MLRFRLHKMEYAGALSNRRTIAILYRRSRELSELQLWKGPGRIAKVQRDNETLMLMVASYNVSNHSSCAGVPFVLSPITWPALTGDVVEYLEEIDLTREVMDEDGSCLKGPGKIIARLWTVGLIPSRFQMAVRRRYDFLSAEVDPARVMEVTQRMVEQFEKARQLVGVCVPMGNGKKVNADGGEVVVGASVKSSGSSLKKTSFRG